MKKRPLRVLYIAYWGAAEPLGRAVLVPPVLKLAARGVKITLLTFEHAEDRKNPRTMAELRRTFRKAGVRWIPVPYHHKPQAPATVFDIFCGALKVLTVPGWRRYDLIHARTLFGGLVGQLIRPVLGAPLLFHNEGYFADERVDSGTWTTEMASYRVVRELEYRLIDSADAIICLAAAARDEIAARPKVLTGKTPVISIPVPVDLDRFTDVHPARWKPGEPLKVIYIGTVGGPGVEIQIGVANRYRLDEIGRFVKRAREAGIDARLRVLTPAPREIVEDLLGQAGLDTEFWSSARVPSTAIPGELAASHVGVHFLNPGKVAYAGSPTKIGEYWSAGLPVLFTPGLGDAADIAEREIIGVTVAEHSEGTHREALKRLLGLLQDPGLEARCRGAAERYLSLETSVKRHLELYEQVGRSRS